MCPRCVTCRCILSDHKSTLRYQSALGGQGGARVLQGDEKATSYDSPARWSSSALLQSSACSPLSLIPSSVTCSKIADRRFTVKWDACIRSRISDGSFVPSSKQIPYCGKRFVSGKDQLPESWHFQSSRKRPSRCNLSVPGFGPSSLKTVNCLGHRSTRPKQIHSRICM